MVASGSADKTIQVWRASDGALLYTYYGYDEPVTSISWATDVKNRIASGGASDGSVQIWDALQDHNYLNWHSDGRVLALDWQANSPWIVSGGTDREIYVWNGLTGAKRASYTGHQGNVRTVLWLPPIQVFTLETSELTTATPGPATPTSGLQSVQDPIASGGADGTVQTWDGDNGKHLFTYTGHTAGVNGLAILRYQPGGLLQALASASDDKTVRVWRPASDSGDDITVYSGHSAHVNAVTALPYIPYYDLRVASASDDHT